MPFLSPAKLLVILVVALIVLGPDKLPKVARQVGGLWGDFKRFREKLEADVRGSFPDLPSTETITQAVRSPISFLDSLAETHAADSGTNEADGVVEAPPPEGDVVVPAGDGNRPAGTVRATDGPSLPAVDLRPRDGVVHGIRDAHVVVPDDPGLN